MDAEVRTPRLSVAALLLFLRVPGERTHTTHTRKKWKKKRLLFLVASLLFWVDGCLALVFFYKPNKSVKGTARRSGWQS